MAAIYADHPFALIPTPVHNESESEPDMFSRVASEMAVVHNIIIRGINSIYLQAPQISSADALPFLSYSKIWYDLVHEHHTGEEDSFFPFVETASGEKGLMEANVQQHHVFHDGLEEYKSYIEDCLGGKQTFDGKKLVQVIDGFGEALTRHLADEIGTLLKLREVGIEKLGQMEHNFQLEGEKNMKKLGLTIGVPFGFYNHDIHYEDGRWANFPPAPKPVHLIVRHVAFWAHRDWWQYASCDRHGKLRPLPAVRT